MSGDSEFCFVLKSRPGSKPSPAFPLPLFRFVASSLFDRTLVVFTLAVGRSFCEQILPAGSVILAWSSWAVQWLSCRPTLISDQVQVVYSRDPAGRAAFDEQAAADWRTFLTHRGRELRLGGRLVADDVRDPKSLHWT